MYVGTHGALLSSQLSNQCAQTVEIIVDGHDTVGVADDEFTFAVVQAYRSDVVLRHIVEFVALFMYVYMYVWYVYVSVSMSANVSPNLR